MTCKSHKVLLVRDAMALATIVLPVDADPLEELAAEEIVRFVELISGAKLPIVEDHSDANTGDMTRILIGAKATEALGDLDVARAQGDRPNTIYPPDGFVLRVGPGMIALAGVNPSGTLYAAYELLERLGCRWYWPGELGQIVPRRNTLALEALETVQTPSLEDRQIYISGEKPSKSPTLNKDVSAETKAWQRRNHLSLHVIGPGRVGHDLSKCLEKDDNLEDPAVLDKVVRHQLEAINADPDRQWWGLGLPDRDCSVTEEQALSLHNPWSAEYHATDMNIRFINQVAEKLLEKYPDKKFGFLAYVNFMAPPISVKPHPSLGPYIAPIESCRRHIAGAGECWHRDAVIQTIKQWCRLSDKVSVWDYEPNFLVDAGIPMPCVSRIRVELPMMHRLGLRGFFSQTQLSVMNTGPNMYIRAKLFWDVNADVDRLLDEYYTDMFGPSAPAVRRYWEALEEMMCHGSGHGHEDEILKHVYPIENIRPLEQHVRHAEAAADSDDIRQRVQAIRFSFDNLMLYLGMRQAEDEGQFGDAAALAREMMQLHLRIEQVNPVFYKIGDLDRGTEDHPHLTAGWIKQNDARQERIDGAMGRLVALLGETWRFRTDPHDKGVLFNWFDLDADISEWDSIRTTRVWEVQGYQDQQGHGYDGVGWYRTSIELPAAPPDDRLLLNFGGVFGAMHIWINGRFIAYRPFADPWWRNPYNDTFDIDITGALHWDRQNTIVIRVHKKQEWGGIFRRAFLWSPKIPTE